MLNKEALFTQWACGGHIAHLVVSVVPIAVYNPHVLCCPKTTEKALMLVSFENFLLERLETICYFTLREQLVASA